MEEKSDTLYLVPLGDIHIGEKAFGKVGQKKLDGYIQWILDRPNAYTFLMGDLLTVATRSSKTSPFEVRDVDEYQRAVELFMPLAQEGKILGAITGNHERRMQDHCGFNPLQPFCNELGIPYLGYSAIVKFRVGLRPKTSNQYWQVYHGYFHHGTGGGTLGGSLNRKVKMADIVQGVDFYASGHDHQLVTGVKTIFEPGQNGVVQKKVTFVDTGSFLDYKDSYAEAGMMVPGKLGAARIRMSGERDNHDVHCSL